MRCATSPATMTPPRGNPATTSASTPSLSKWRPSFCPASWREANSMYTPRPVWRENQPEKSSALRFAGRLYFPRARKSYIVNRKCLADQSTNFFPNDDALQILRAEQVEDDDRHFVVHAQRERRGIHDFELFLERFEIGDLRKSFGRGIFLRVRIVNAVDLGRFQDHFRADFVGTKRGRGVRRKIGVARAAAENHHPVFLQMANGAAANERFGDLGHGNGRLHARGDADFFQSILQSQRVDDSREHAHVIAGGALNAAFAAGQAAKDISATDDDHDLNAQFANFADLLGHAVDSSARNADAGFAAQRLAAEFQQNSFVFGSLLFHVSLTANRAAAF